MFLVALSFSLAAVHMTSRAIEKIIAAKTRYKEWKNHEMISLFFCFSISRLSFYSTTISIEESTQNGTYFVNNSTVWNRLYSDTIRFAYLAYTLACGMIGLAFLLVNTIKGVEFSTNDCRELTRCSSTK
ncbi:hypothetical protein PRIPAC_76097 [Pristionchus pacificus]|uniref:Uncharacterized protein n=1 Tax=Pristionchus pacificus TaxID=54126 RepID=A0A2A6C713_PRIPA|nr:hypothetical protein PRIPAC_76097 [Pristionchus pacificus]|eukprot:PDM73907.1 hypothetical protein PRIPAC_41263 [Pristionchus pacificus]